MSRGRPKKKKKGHKKSPKVPGVRRGRGTLGAEIELPALRQDVALVKVDDPRFGWALVDERLKVQVPLDGTGRLIVEAMAVPRTAAEVLDHVHGAGERRLNPVRLRKQIRLLARYGLLVGARAGQIEAAGAEPAGVESVDPDTVDLSFADGLRHACQSCGSCCSATDIGPVAPDIVEAVREGGLHQHIAEVDADDLFRHVRHEGQEIHLTQMRNDQCVFLGADRLCLIHKTLGVAKKPTPCRQFPLVFSRIGDTVAVSVQMECRAYWQAKTAAKPMAEEASVFRDLLRIGASVRRIAGPIRVDAGLMIAPSEYQQVETALIAAVRGGHHQERGLFAPLVAFGRTSTAVLDALYGEIDAEENAYLSTPVWAAAFPGRFSEDPVRDARAGFATQEKTFFAEARTFSREATEIASERDLPWLSQRFRVLTNALDAASGLVDPSSFRFRDEVACAEVMQDLLVSGLTGREAVRSGRSLRFGLGVLGLRALLTLYGACFRAKEACRVEVTLQDLIDTMVTLSKMLRERAVIEFLTPHRQAVEDLFSRNLDVFAHRGDPHRTVEIGLR